MTRLMLVLTMVITLTGVPTEADAVSTERWMCAYDAAGIIRQDAIVVESDNVWFGERTAINEPFTLIRNDDFSLVAVATYQAKPKLFGIILNKRTSNFILFTEEPGEPAQRNRGTCTLTG